MDENLEKLSEMLNAFNQAMRTVIVQEHQEGRRGWEDIHPSECLTLAECNIFDAHSDQDFAKCVIDAANWLAFAWWNHTQSNKKSA